MSFRTMVEEDISKVYLNSLEFAERHDIRYDGVEYELVPVVIQNTRERDRREHRVAYQDDNSQGLYLTRKIVYVARDSIGGVQPEQGTKLEIRLDDGYWHDFHVRESRETHGMIYMLLEAMCE